MASEKSTAIVLRTVDFSESSLVCTLFSRDFGKMSALAKGARRAKSAFESALDLLSLCRIVFLPKSSDALDLLTEAKLERRFRVQGRSLSHLYAGYYVAELLNVLTHQHDPFPDLFDLADETLAHLASGRDAVGIRVLRFEFALLTQLGHAPQLRDCVECGQPPDEAGRIHFGILLGGVLCKRCREGKKHVISLSSQALQNMQELSENCLSPRTADCQSVTGVGELRSVMNQYLSHLAGQSFHLHEFLPRS